jgi:hypothetical protein
VHWYRESTIDINLQITLFVFSITGVEEGFMPWLISEVKQEINQMFSSREVLTGS